jgi:GNAT superfamily N-acetyltransferase
MTAVKFIIGDKEEIPSKYLNQIFKLLQDNRKEIFDFKPPAIEFFKQVWIHGYFPERKSKYLIAINNEDSVIGYANAGWNIKYDNLDRGYFWIYVKPEERRKKIGTAILKELVKVFPDIITTISSEAFEDTAAVHFMSSFEKKESYTEVLSQSNLIKFNPEKVKKEAQKLKKHAEEKGYDIIYIDNFEHELHCNLPKFVQMVEDIWNDMPREELTYGDDVLTADRYRQIYQIQILLGFHILTFVAIHKETGDPVGLTCTYTSKYQPEVALQEDTGVLRKYRGNNLGLTLKYQMLDKLLSDSKVKFWRTGNAGSNEHMLRINKMLKYEPTQRIFIFEFGKDELLKKLKKK